LPNRLRRVLRKREKILERALRKALKDRDEALRELATAARWVIARRSEKKRALPRRTKRY
jgi:hypothetical protein